MKKQCRVAPSIGKLEGDPNDVWGTIPYTNEEEPAVFFGLYGLPDFYTLWRHKGKKWILWAGSDVTHFQNGYWLEDGGNIRIDPTPLAQWIDKNCESWVENEVERKALEELGIQSEVAQSFMGDVNDYKVTYKAAERPQVYLSVSGNNFRLYGWDTIEQIADKCNVDFHLYGNTEEWKTKHANVVVHGRVSKEQMNEEIQHMQSGLRLCTDMDGFSEVTVKSLLWGQYPIVAQSFKYPHIDSFRSINNLIFQLNRLNQKGGPNPAREYYINRLNNYPWTK